MAHSKELADLIEELSAQPVLAQTRHTRQAKKRSHRKKVSSSPPHLTKVSKTIISEESDTEENQPRTFTTTATCHATQEPTTPPQFSPDPNSPHNSPLPVPGPSASKQAEPQFSQFMGWLQAQINSSVQNAVAQHTTPSVRPKIKQISQPSLLSASVSDSASLSDSQESETSSDTSSSDEVVTSKQPEDVKLLIRYLQDTLEIKETQLPISKVDKVLGNNPKKSRTFPTSQSISKIISEEWSDPDKRNTIPQKLLSKYPVAEEFQQTWDKSPKVDSAIVRLSRNTTLPSEDAGSFRDPMDKKIESSLKRDFLHSAAILRPASASLSVARTARFWCQELRDSSYNSQPETSLIIDKISLALSFLSEASLEITKLASRASAASVTARRALWLRQWAGDTASKHRLVALKFEGVQLFGPQLKQIISEVTGGKGSFLPQGKKPRRENQRRNYHHRSWGSYSRTNSKGRSNQWNNTSQHPSQRRSRPWQSQQKTIRKGGPPKSQDS